VKEEIWKEIEGFDGDYLISNHGRVKSFKRNKNGIIMKQNINRNGYWYTQLYFKKYFYKTIHRLVAEAFVVNPNPDEYDQVNHIDENKQNNYFENLEWCNTQYNKEYSTSKNYKILFPDKHEEIIFNLRKFCRENNLNRGDLYNTFTKGYYHHKYRILEIIERDGKIKKAKPLVRRKGYKIQIPSGKKILTFNLQKFCVEHNLISTSINTTFKSGYFIKGYKIVEIIDRDGNITKCAKRKNTNWVYQILNPLKEIQNIDNLNYFCKENNLDLSSMYKTLKNKEYFHKGYKILSKEKEIIYS
jgi:hypothetical protein